MLFPDDIQKTMRKLAQEYEGGTKAEGEIRFSSERGAENRYSYYLRGKLVFTFGISRSSRTRSKKLYYIPRQMHLSNNQYKSLYECPMSKKDYNEILLEKFS